MTEPPVCVNKQGAIQIIGSPALLADLEADRLVVPLTDGPRKWYSIINLKNAVLERVQQKQEVSMLDSRKGHVLLPLPVFVLRGIDLLTDRLRLAFRMAWVFGFLPRLGDQSICNSAEGAGSQGIVHRH